MGDATPGDGRLDLDDLDGALDGAATFDVLEAGAEPRWSDRVTDSRLGQRVASHRVVVLASGALCVLVVGSAVVAHGVLPPPFDPQLRVTALPFEPAELPGEDLDWNEVTPFIKRASSGTHRAAYALRPDQERDRDAYRILGLVGPGIRASTGHPIPPGSGLFGSNVDALIDCWDSSALVPGGERFELVVERTDAAGRRLVGRVAEPGGWSLYVGAVCAQERAATDIHLESVTAEPAPGRSVRVVYEVSSDLPLDTTVDVGGSDRQGIDSESPPVQLAANGEATVTTRYDIGDCSSEFHLDYGRLLPNGEYGEVPGVDLHVVVPPGVETWVGAPWSAEVAARVNAVLAAACAGAPRVSAVVRSATVDGDRTLFQKQAEVALAVESEGRSVTLTMPPRDGEGDAVRTTRPLEGGRAVLPITLEFVCSEIGEPPVLEFTVTSSRGEVFPFVVPMTGARLTEAVYSVCAPVVMMEDMLAWGWVPSGVDDGST